MINIVRRRRLGMTSVREVVRYLNEMGVPAKERKNWRPATMVGIQPDDITIRWGCTSNVEGKKVNDAKAIHTVSDKGGCRRLLQKAMPEHVPETWFDVDDENIKYPCILRPSTHSRGKNFHVCSNHRELLMWAGRYPDYYISKLVEKSREYRVFVFKGRVAWVARKTPGNPDDVAWNVAQGGRFDNVRWGEWPQKVCAVACQAAEIAGIDFTGVDVMTNDAGTPFIIELNSAPSQTSPYRQECVAKAIAYHAENGWDTLAVDQVVRQDNNYLRFIHPGVNN